MIKHQNEQMSDERTQFLQKWLTAESSHESRESEQFINNFLHLVSTDKTTQQIFAKNLKGFLQSKQKNLQKIFIYCLNSQQRIYQKQICLFLKECVSQRSAIFLQQSIEKYILHNIWRDNLQKYVKKSGITQLQIIQYLSLKMRSLSPVTRNQAVDSLERIIENIFQGKKSSFFVQVQKILPQMIEKQNYGKEVCFYRGVLLQILQDQFCHIKKKGIQLLGKAQSFFQTSMIRPLILYMLNDEHQEVRQTCLIALSKITSLDLQKQDLSALLVCLKENNTSMRNYTYESLCHINITSSNDFKTIFDKLFSTLLNKAEDKKRIYIVCSKLGKKYPNYVLSNLQHIYKFNDNQQPNWKNLGYRARLITVASMGKEKWPQTLPKYFVSHYLYVRDVLVYVFNTKQQNSPLMVGINQHNTASQMQQQTASNKININLETNWQLYQYIQALYHASQGFIKSIFSIILEWARTTKLGKYTDLQIIKNQQLKLQKLYVMYDIYNKNDTSMFIKSIAKVIQDNNFNQLKNILLNIRQSNLWNQLEKIENILFKVTNADKTKIVISNRPEILKKSFVEFSNFGPASNQEHQNGQMGYLRMSQVDFEQVNQKICTYKINFKCKQLRCLILYGNPPMQYIVHTSAPEE